MYQIYGLYRFLFGRGFWNITDVEKKNPPHGFAPHMEEFFLSTSSENDFGYDSVWVGKRFIEKGL